MQRRCRLHGLTGRANLREPHRTESGTNGEVLALSLANHLEQYWYCRASFGLFWVHITSNALPFPIAFRLPFDMAE